MFAEKNNMINIYEIDNRINPKFLDELNTILNREII